MCGIPPVGRNGFVLKTGSGTPEKTPRSRLQTRRISEIAPNLLAAARNNVPAVHSVPYFARDGGLLSYGVDRVDTYRRAATYVDRILRGEKPGDLPVQFPTKFQMVVNRKTATA